MPKALLLINLRGSIIGGAQRRYLSLYNYVAENRDDYYLIINDQLYSEAVKKRLLTGTQNIKIIKLPSLGKKKNRVNDSKKGEFSYPRKYISIKKRLGAFKGFIKLFIIWGFFSFQFIRIIRDYRIESIYSMFTGGMWSWPILKMGKCRLIYSYNDSSLWSLDRKIIKFFDSEYWVLKKADCIDFLSQGIISRLENKIGPIEPERISVTPNSFISYDKFYPEYPKENFVTFLARLYSVKNPILYLKAIRIFNQKYKRNNIKFYLIGEGMEKEIDEFIKENGLNNVEFIKKHFQPWKFLRRSKIFVSIQQDENYPSQSLLEAMACENAIVASDVGETRKLVSENEGILVPLNAEKIADAILELFSDPDSIERLGKNARKKAIENHTIEKYSEYFFNITSSPKGSLKNYEK